MAELEKTIQGLTFCLKESIKVSCDGCPYRGGGCMDDLMADALSLLKVQEPKFVSDIAEAIIGCKPKVKVGHCPSCGVLMSETDRYCRKCGQAVKWNDESGSD